MIFKVKYSKEDERLFAAASGTAVPKENPQDYAEIEPKLYIFHKD